MALIGLVRFSTVALLQLEAVLGAPMLKLPFASELLFVKHAQADNGTDTLDNGDVDNYLVYSLYVQPL